MKDLEQQYDELISPLMTEIIKVCNEIEMPMFATFQYSDHNFCSTCIGSFPGTDRKIKDCVKLVREGYMAFAVVARKDGSKTVVSNVEVEDVLEHKAPDVDPSQFTEIEEESAKEALVELFEASHALMFEENPSKELRDRLRKALRLAKPLTEKLKAA